MVVVFGLKNEYIIKIRYLLLLILCWDKFPSKEKLWRPESKAMSEEATSSSPSTAATSISYEEIHANVAQAFEQWMKEYKLVYSSDEEKEKCFIRLCGEILKGPKTLYTVGLSLFTDMDDKEVEAFHCIVPTMDNLPLAKTLCFF